MYYEFSPEICTYRNQTLVASPTDATALLQPDMNNAGLHWWLAVPLPKPPSVELTFSINSNAPLLDNYDTGTLFDLYSDRLVALLRDVGVRFETFPANVIDRKSGRPVECAYYVFHLLEKYDVLYESDYREWRRVAAITGEGPGGSIKVEGPPWNLMEKPMFRPGSRKYLVVVHKSVKTRIENEGLTGCSFEPFGRAWVAES